MSCRTTSGGKLTLRLARHYSGLKDKDVQEIFHALKREGKGLPTPTQTDLDAWKAQQRVMINNSKLSLSQKQRSEYDLWRTVADDCDAETFYAWSNVVVRARQEQVLREMHGNIVDISPPGSQKDSYTFDESGRPAKVWYASYGSNMNKERFLTYITGGTPAGSHTAHEGCRDTNIPENDIPIRFNGRMHFAYASGRWEGGGVAFMDNDGVSHALGRAYPVTSEQFDDIVAQENGGRFLGVKKVDLNAAIENGNHDGPGLYGNLVHIGDYNGSPVFTFTGNFSANSALMEATTKKYSYHGTNTPSDNYIRMVGQGLSETFGMDERQQADYLRGCLGLCDTSRKNILQVLRTPPTEPPKPKTSSNYKNIRSPQLEKRLQELKEERDNDTSVNDIWGDLIKQSRRERRAKDKAKKENAQKTQTRRKQETEDREIRRNGGTPHKRTSRKSPVTVTKVIPKGTENMTEDERRAYIRKRVARKPEFSDLAGSVNAMRKCFICQEYGHSMHECPDLHSASREDL